MTPRKLNVLACTFSYGGNGATASTHPDVSWWLAWTARQIEKDERCNLIIPEPRKLWLDLSDTPITMTRNQAVLRARELKADVLLFVDSDMRPDMTLDRRLGAKPFWESSFDFLYRHWEKGPVAVGAPYCGPPPGEICYVFHWQNWESEVAEGDHQLVMYSRHEAYSQTGIQPVAALPTGCILYDMRCFEVCEPEPIDIQERMTTWALQRFYAKEQFTEQDVSALVERVCQEKARHEGGWFYYEYPDKYQGRKASTEDVTQTRDLSFLGTLKLGYSPVFCNWDAWAGHWKPKLVGPPDLLTAEQVSDRYRRAVERNARENERQTFQQSGIFDEIDWSKAVREEMRHDDSPNGKVTCLVPAGR